MQRRLVGQPVCCLGAHGEASVTAVGSGQGGGNAGE
tara:strand:- start:404 stop:511 length:108 start_codon:yes stop_codon:yes gene_type:complete